MAIPLIIGAFLIEFKELGQVDLSLRNMSLGFIAAFVFGLLALWLVEKTLISNKFKNFAYYCLILALFILVI